jgi:DNA-directed RNA polymerase subunit RPC12/RpoP
MANYYCEYCGIKATSIASLVMGTCMRHPNGANKGKHKLYEGSEKSQYFCRYCGSKSSTIAGLTIGTCFKHPNGANKGKHSPAL